MHKFFKKFVSSPFLNHQKAYTFSTIKKDVDFKSPSPLQCTHSGYPNFSVEQINYQNQQTNEISKAFNTFIEQLIRKEGKDAKEIIMDNAYEISKQLQEYGYVKTELLNLDYVDLRYFRVEKDGLLYSLNNNVTKMYTDNYIISDRIYNTYLKKTNQLKELKDQVRCEYQRLITQCLIEEEEDIEIGCKGDYQKIYKEKIVASLNPKITLKDNEKMLAQIPDIDSCPKFFDCIVLNEEEKQIFLLKFEEKLTDLYYWYEDGDYCEIAVEKYEAIVYQAGYNLFTVISEPYIYFEDDYSKVSDLQTDEGFYCFSVDDLKQYENKYQREGF